MHNWYIVYGHTTGTLGKLHCRVNQTKTHSYVSSQTQSSSLSRILQTARSADFAQTPIQLDCRFNDLAARGLTRPITHT